MSAADLILEACHADATGDEDRRWDIVWHLHAHGGREALDAAAGLLSDPSAACRALAADVLAQLRDAPLREPALLLLLDAIDHEQDPDVLYSIAVGFGHHADPRCLEPLRRLHTHPDPDLRYGVVFGLLGLTDRGALDLLITLSADGDDKVRDWATFGLARQSTADFPALRDALAARADDPDAETRAEALHGLATRGDARVVRPLLDVLAAPVDGDFGDVVDEALFAAAAAFPGEGLCAHVTARRDQWLADSPGAPAASDPPDDLLAALAACSR